MFRTVFCVMLAFAAAPFAANASDQSALGDWSGALHQGHSAYRVRFHVAAAHDGRLTALVSGLPGDNAAPAPGWAEKSGDELVIGVAGGRWSGSWDQAQGAWVGSWRQAELSVPLVLRWDGDSRTPTMLHPLRVIPALPALPAVPAR